MSGRHAERSRCRACGERCRVEPTELMYLVRERRLRMWAPLKATLCPSCRQQLLELLEPRDSNIVSDTGQEPLIKEAEPTPLVCWPRSSRQSWLDARRSALWR